MRIIDLKGVDKLIHLKYLGVRCCETLKVSEFSLGHLKNLETLDVRDTFEISILPDLWTINTLRYALRNGFLPEVPWMADLPNLQTLDCIPFNNKTIPHLNNLRRLGFENISSKWDVDHAVPHLLGGLSSITSLKMMSLEANLPMEIIYPRALPNYQNLQILYLVGNWSKSVTLKASLFPPHLIKLTLMDSKLGQDPMPELGKLNNLKKLRLLGDLYNEKQMICPAGFPILQSLVLSVKTVEVLTVEKGVMPKLKNLSKYKIKLEMPPDLMHLILDRGKI